MKNRALLLIDFQKGIESPTQQLYRLPEVLLFTANTMRPLFLFNMKKPN